MQGMFRQCRDSYQEQENVEKQRRERILGEMREMEALHKQLEEQNITDLTHIKKNYLTVLNDCKRHLRKHIRARPEPIR